MNLAVAVESQRAWQSKPVDDNLVKRETYQRTKTKHSTHVMTEIYNRHMDHWVSWAKESPRNITELREHMYDLCGYRPTECTCYKWAADRFIDVRSDRPKLGLSKIAGGMLDMRNSGRSIEQIVEHLASIGIEVSKKQVSSAVGHAARGRR